MMDMPFDESQRQLLLQYFRITNDGLAILGSLREVLSSMVDPLLDELYEHLSAFPVTKALFQNEASLQRAQEAQRRHFMLVFSGDAGEELFQNAWSLGEAYDRIGMEPCWFMGCYSKCLSSPQLLDRLSQNPAEGAAPLQAIAKIVSLAIALVWESYYLARESRLKEVSAKMEQKHRETEGVYRIAMQALNQRAELTEQYELEIEGLRRKLGELPETDTL